MLSGVYAKPTEKDTLSAEEQQQFLYYFYEAQRFIQKEALKPAWELVQFCYELNPNDATINNYMGVFKDAQGTPQEAVPYLRRAFELQPNEYWYQYAVYLLQSKDKKSEKLAIRNLEQVAKNNPKNEELHGLLQKAYIHVKDYKRALRIQDQLDSISGYNAMSAIESDSCPFRYIYRKNARGASCRNDRCKQDSGDSSVYGHGIQGLL